MNIFDKDLIGEKPMNPFMEVLKIKIYVYIIMPKKQTKRIFVKTQKLVDVMQNKEIKKLKKDVKKLKEADEKKWLDRIQNSKAISTTSALDPMLDLTVWGGTDNDARQNQREGNTLLLTSLKFDGLVYIDKGFANPDANNIVRLILVQMTDDNSAAPNGSDILETDDVRSFYKLKGNRRYKIHYDKRFYLQCTNQTYSSSSAIMPTNVEPWRKRFIIKAKIPKKGLKVTYKQGTISGNGPVVNGFYLLSVSDSGAISHPAMEYHSRMRFLDN
jgi:hypothetical protein